jgi:hypothetical protein
MSPRWVSSAAHALMTPKCVHLVSAASVKRLLWCASAAAQTWVRRTRVLLTANRPRARPEHSILQGSSSSAYKLYKSRASTTRQPKPSQHLPVRLEASSFPACSQRSHACAWEQQSPAAPPASAAASCAGHEALRLEASMLCLASTRQSTLLFTLPRRSTSIARVLVLHHARWRAARLGEQHLDASRRPRVKSGGGSEALALCAALCSSCCSQPHAPVASAAAAPSRLHPITSLSPAQHCSTPRLLASLRRSSRSRRPSAANSATVAPARGVARRALAQHAHQDPDDPGLQELQGPDESGGVQVSAAARESAVQRAEEVVLWQPGKQRHRRAQWQRQVQLLLR